MKHFLFECTASDNKGEEFLVGAGNLLEACEIAEDNFGTDCVSYICIVSEEEAEASGLDEY